MLAWLERYQLLALGFAAALLVAGLLVLDRREGGGPPAIVFYDGPTDSSGPVLVHVAGAVANPGLYELPAGARVHEAIAAAGGHTADARPDDINLARPLRDGEKISVPGPGTSGRSACPTLAAGEKLNLNSAPQCLLMELPGIGEAYSRRIVDSRTVDGPFSSVDDLLTRRLIPGATFERIRELLTVSLP